MHAYRTQLLASSWLQDDSYKMFKAAKNLARNKLKESVLVETEHGMTANAN